MYTIHVDPIQNQMKIKISGTISLAEAKTASVLIRNKLFELAPGAVVIDDLTQFQMSDPRAGLYLQGVLKLFVERDVRAVIRIVGPSKMAIVLFSKFSQIFQGQIPIHYIPSVMHVPALLEQISA